MTQIQLPLAPASAAQHGRAVVRVPMDKMAELALQAGDTVAITGARTTHARVMPAPRGGATLETTAELAQNAGGDWGGEAEVSAAALPALNSVIVKALGDEIGTAEDLSETLYDLPLTVGDQISVVMPLGRKSSFEVTALDPAPAGLFCETTSLSIAARPADTHRYEDIGGMSEQIARVHEMVAAPLLRPELFARLGVSAPRGVLFTGPPGSGKTLLARSIAAKTSAAFFQINGPEIVSKHYGESEAALRNIFAAAAKDSPAIVFIDEIDAIAPKRDVLSGEKQVERRVVAQLLTLMDGLSERGRIIVMAATNLPDSLDAALRRPGRFDREINFGPPTAAQREEILEIHLRKAPLAQDVALDLIARDSHGYVGADLAALAREASLAALDRMVTQAGGEQNVKVDELFITQADLLHGLNVTSPSTLRETQVESPVVTWDDVGGMQAAKEALTEAVIWPQQHRTAFQALNLKAISGVLMSGPPGSGKTLLARALAFESGMNFIPVRPTRIMSQFLGDAERAIADIFAKARQSAPTLIFFDELDALAPRRSGKDAVLDRIVAQMLAELDGLAVNTDIVVLGATNRAAAVDPALTRPGRFDLIVPIGLPDEPARRAILDVHCRDLPLSDDVDLDHLAAQTKDASGARLAGLVTSAARAALRRALAGSLPTPEVTQADFDAAVQLVAVSDQALDTDFIAEKG